MQRNLDQVAGWTSPSDLHAQVQRLWDRGELLASVITGKSPFPKRLSLRVPTSAEMTERFDDVRSWIQALQVIPRCRLEMREFKHRILGTNQVPDSAWIDSIEDA